VFELRYVRDRHDYGRNKLQYRYVQPTVDASGALCPGEWTDWIDVPMIFIEDKESAE
jgi:hypothetical protein